MSPPQGAQPDTFPKRSFESVIVGYILSLESHVTAPFGRYLIPTERKYIGQEQLDIASSITQSNTSSNDLLKKIGAIPLSDINTFPIPVLRYSKSWI